MDAGKLNDRVAFDAVVETPDGSGGQVRTWDQRFVCWAQFIYSRGSEEVVAARLQGQSIFKVKVRGCAATRVIDPAWRLRDIRRGLPTGVTGDLLPGDRYNIREVDPITDRAWVYLVVERGVAV